MGFFQILRSIEDLLYEVMTWLVFYPRTMLRVLRHPVRMTDYSDTEQGESAEEQYTDMLSPPLFLILSILIAHGLELAMHTRLDVPKAGLAGTLLRSEENLLMLRCILFSIFPLVFATGLLKGSDKMLDRANLRAPFFAQCYLGGIFALAVSTASIMGQAKASWVVSGGIALSVISAAWYVAVQSMWFREHLPISAGRSVWTAFITFLKGTFVNAAIAGLFFT